MNKNIEVYDAVTLPNGGIITMNKQAYEAFTGQGRSNHRGHWTCTIEFEGDDNHIETAAIEMNNIERRGVSDDYTIELR